MRERQVETRVDCLVAGIWRQKLGKRLVLCHNFTDDPAFVAFGGES